MCFFSSFAFSHFHSSVFCIPCIHIVSINNQEKKMFNNWV